MANGINYTEGDKITPNRDFPPVTGIELPKKGKIYTCESLFKIGDTWAVYLKEITSSTPNVIEYKGQSFKIKDGCGPRNCYGAHCFDKVEPKYLDITKEIADSVGVTEEVPDIKKVKELQPQTN